MLLIHELPQKHDIWLGGPGLTGGSKSHRSFKKSEEFRSGWAPRTWELDLATQHCPASTVLGRRCLHCLALPQTHPTQAPPCLGHTRGVLWERNSVWKVGFMRQGMVRVPGGAEKTMGIHSDQCPLHLLQDKDPRGSQCRQVINTRPQVPGLPDLCRNTKRTV